MKISMLFWSFVVLAIFPAYLSAQEIKLPTVEIRVSRDLIPAKVKDAVLNDFGEGHKPFAWVNGSTVFDAYQWSQSMNPRIFDIFSYSLHSKTSTGSTLDVTYTADGKLINSKEFIRNFRPSLSIMLALQNTEWKDWGIIKDYRIIKVSSNGAEKERYALVLNKGNKKETVFVDGHGRKLAEISGDHGELADLDW